MAHNIASPQPYSYVLVEVVMGSDGTIRIVLSFAEMSLEVNIPVDRFSLSLHGRLVCCLQLLVKQTTLKHGEQNIIMLVVNMGRILLYYIQFS
jgi:hypothetical protein